MNPCTVHAAVDSAPEPSLKPDAPARAREPGRLPDVPSGQRAGDETAASFQKGWWIHALESVDSTNSVAAGLPAWHAVRAAIQSCGRGRTGRRWVSDRGGLWLSAVVPYPAREQEGCFLPLMAGVAVARILRRLGVRNLRLRWPNDLMIGNKKLSGILVDRVDSGRAVIGIGINVVNTPANADAALTAMTARLADLLETLPTLNELTVLVLSAIRSNLARLESKGVPAFTAELNSDWVQTRQVELTVRDGAVVSGQLIDIDPAGALRIEIARGERRTYHAVDVVLLRELE